MSRFDHQDGDEERFDRVVATLSGHAEGRSAAGGANLQDPWERVAAEVALAAAVEGYQPLPESLRTKLAVEAAATVGATLPSSGGAGSSPGFDLPDRGPGRASPIGLPWILAAASLLVAVLGWMQAWSLPFEPSPAAARARLVAGEGDEVLRLPWTATDDPAAAAASGDVVWSTKGQQGYLRFRGLPANDSRVEQYQLWIFDGQQDERYPIDGGVFDIPPEGGDVVVPIRPAIRVAQPTMFAVTIEKPGGVVVSSRERLPLLAKVE